MFMSAGFEFVRISFLLLVPNLLQWLRVLRSGTALRLARLSCVASFVILASAGVFHLVRASNVSSNSAKTTTMFNAYATRVFMCRSG